MSSTTWVPPGLDAVPRPPTQPRKDMHSFSNIAQIHPEGFHLDWEIDWVRKIIFGSVTHKIGIDEDGVSEVVLDSSYLELGRISVDGVEVQADVAPRQGTLGSALTIPLKAPASKGDILKIKIEYSTTDKSTALGWLTKEQTLSKKGPFLYSQCQAIHARSLLPCIDSPSHRSSYTATVKSAYPVLMSALKDDEAHKESPSKHDPTIYHFKQPRRIPSYLIAIISAILEFRPLGARVGVWAEPAMADAAQWEFQEDAERFLQAAESTISPYSWERYDCIVLPPAFAYGGMENHAGWYTASIKQLPRTRLSSTSSSSSGLKLLLLHLDWSELRGYLCPTSALNLFKNPTRSRLPALPPQSQSQHEGQRTRMPSSLASGVVSGSGETTTITIAYPAHGGNDDDAESVISHHQPGPPTPPPLLLPQLAFATVAPDIYRCSSSFPTPFPTPHDDNRKCLRTRHKVIAAIAATATSIYSPGVRVEHGTQHYRKPTNWTR
ncbi:hypothetical protein A4X13_0g7487 [Tilletia indica]|uniref:Aminopeptidase N-like N-terminal domain-containing protein n=1 Tax=Tilletia indica TaxID=43049 RepID=A0A8T8SKT8_9BASI|nr:hypothetical protein A4X13_0g7487 [Tilletia indica]